MGPAKLKKAEKLGLKIISEEEFDAMLAEADSPEAVPEAGTAPEAEPKPEAGAAPGAAEETPTETAQAASPTGAAPDAGPKPETDAKPGSDGAARQGELF